MQLPIALVFALNILGVENRAQFRQALDPQNSNCICTPFQSCYDKETSSVIKDIVDDRIALIENRQAITFTQESEPADCPDSLDICCYNLFPPPVSTPITNPSPQPQSPSPSQISPQTSTTIPSPQPQSPSPSWIFPQTSTTIPSPQPQSPSPSQISPQISTLNPSPQTQPPNPSQISTQTPTTTPSPQPQSPSPSRISPQTPEAVQPTAPPGDVTLPVVTSQPIASNGQCGVRNSDGVGFTIEGFTEGQAQYGEFPWMVAVLTSAIDLGAKNLYVGGGSLIDPLFVLTAAHKPFDTNKTLTVRIGEWNFAEVSEPNQHQDIPVKEIIYHPRFNRDLVSYNYALLVLERPAELGETVGTICLPSNPRQRFNGQQCIVSGWGKDVFGKEGRHQRILKLVNVNMVEHLQCQSAMQTTRLGSNFKLHPSFVCAGDQGQDACTGDGGAPLVCPDPTSPGQYVQVGISSWGIGCGQMGIPGVYSAVAPAIEWIQDTINTILAQDVDLRTVFTFAARCPTHLPYVRKCGKCTEYCEECYRFNSKSCRCSKKFGCRPQTILR